MSLLDILVKVFMLKVKLGREVIKFFNVLI